MAEPTLPRRVRRLRVPRAAPLLPPTAPPCSHKTPSGISLSNGFQPIPTPPTAANFQGTFAYAAHQLRSMGMVQQYNVNVERQLPGNIVLTAGYAGSQGTHILVVGNNLTPSSPTACGTVATTRSVATSMARPTCRPISRPTSTRFFSTVT